MKALKFLKNSAGISMVEVLMAVSVMGGLSLTVAQLMKNTSENVKQNEAKSENINLKAMVQDTLGNTVACKNSFNALISAANLTAMTGAGRVTVPNIRDKGNAIRYSTASTNLAPLTITSISLTNYLSSSSTADLLIEATFKKSTSVIVMVKPIRIPINLSISGTSTLITCSAMAVGGEWLLGGNAGTADGTDFIGTSDNQPLNFKVNNQKSGRIDSGGPTFFGYLAGNVSTAPYNTAIGFKSLNLATTGNYNTAVGYESQTTSTGQENTSLGLWAMRYNTTGNYNTALGSIAFMSNTTGEANVAIGADAMYGGASGSFNTAVGRSALTQNTGSNNIAIGYNASLQSNNSNDNVTIGTNAMQELRTGSGNIAIGTNAGTNINSGANNIVIGHASSTYFAAATSDKLYIDSSSTAAPLIGGDFSSAGRFVTVNGKLGIGVSNPAHKLQIGVITGTTSTNSPDVLSLGGTYSTTPGSNAKLRLLDAGGSSYYGLGVSPSSLDVMALAGVTFYMNKVGVVKNVHFAQSGNVGIGLLNPSYQLQLSTDSAAKPGTSTWTIASDFRLKNIRAPFTRGLADLEGINPIYFKYKADNELGLPSDKEYVGIIAQDAKKAIPESVQKDNKGYFHVNNDSIIWTMFNGIKELYSKILALMSSDEKQNREIKTLKAENEKLKADLKNQAEQFDQRMKKIESGMPKIK